MVPANFIKKILYTTECHDISVVICQNKKKMEICAKIASYGSTEINFEIIHFNGIECVYIC